MISILFWNSNTDIHCRGVELYFERGFHKRSFKNNNEKLSRSQGGRGQSGKFLFAVLFKEIEKQKKTGGEVNPNDSLNHAAKDRKNERKEGRKEGNSVDKTSCENLHCIAPSVWIGGGKSKQDRFYSSLGIISGILREVTNRWVRLQRVELLDHLSLWPGPGLSSHCLSLLSLAHHQRKISPVSLDGSFIKNFLFFPDNNNLQRRLTIWQSGSCNWKIRKVTFAGFLIFFISFEDILRWEKNMCNIQLVTKVCEF